MTQTTKKTIVDLIEVSALMKSIYKPTLTDGEKYFSSNFKNKDLYGNEDSCVRSARLYCF